MGEVAGLSRALDLVALLPLAACLLSAALPSDQERSGDGERLEGATPSEA